MLGKTTDRMQGSLRSGGLYKQVKFKEFYTWSWSLKHVLLLASASIKNPGQVAKRDFWSHEMSTTVPLPGCEKRGKSGEIWGRESRDKPIIEISD